MLRGDEAWSTEEILRQAKRFARAARNRHKLTTTDVEDLQSHLTLKMLALPKERQSWPYVLSCIRGWSYDWARQNIYPVRYPKNFSGLMPSASKEAAREKIFRTLPYQETRIDNAKKILACLPELIGGPLIDYLDGYTPKEIGVKWGVCPSLVFQRINRFDKLLERKAVWQQRSQKRRQQNEMVSKPRVRGAVG